jgi:hypothetical protein
VRVCDACARLPMQDRLIVLQLAWGVVATEARNAFLSIPGGFPAEKSRQLEQLRQMAEQVEAAEPDLELECLIQEDDIEGLMRHVQRLLRKHDEKGGPE